MRNWFKDVSSSEELRRQYFKLAKMYHSDLNGGDDVEMKEINAQYHDLYPKFKDIHENLDKKSDEPTYVSKTPCKEAPEDFIRIIDFLLGLDGVEVELCGRWLWISGDTKKYKESLKGAGCRWSHNKMMWSWHYEEDSTGWHRPYTIDEIRNTYGTTSYRKDDDKLLLA